MPESEEKKIYPLTGEEIQDAVLYKIKESMAKTCNLRPTDAYRGFKAEIEIHLMLDDFGNLVHDNHKVIVSDGAIDPQTAQETEAAFEIEPAPPNVVREDTEQPIPQQVEVEGKKVTKYIRYGRRKPPAVSVPKETKVTS